MASAPAIIHYLPPIVTSVRHLPYSTSGIDNLDITTRAGGLPTGGAAYNGFVPSQLDAAIAAASSKVGVANSAQMTASTIYETKKREKLTLTDDMEACEMSSLDPPPDCTSFNDALVLKSEEVSKYKSEESVHRVYGSTVVIVIVIFMT